MSDDVHTLAAAYALDALDPEERRRFEAHYPGCETCAAEVRDYRRTAARLGATVPTPLPPGLRDRVLAQVDRTPQLPPLVAPTAATPSDQPASDRPAPATAPSDRSARRRRWPRPLLAVAAAIVALALAGGLYLWRDDGGSGRQSTELADVLAAPDAQTVRLSGDGDGTLRVVYSEQEGRAVVVGADLPDPGDGRTYQLWAISDGTATSAGVFDPNRSGHVERSVDAPSGPVDQWGVTNEPTGGSPSATTGMVFEGSA